MDNSQFDRISRLLAERKLNRRAAMAAGGGMVAAGMIGGHLVAGQGSTPAATPAAGERPQEFLFVQSFGSGSMAAADGGDGSYTLTLGSGLGETLFFSDRPERVVGTVPTPTFLDALGFQPDNPPNAALVADTGKGDQEIFVLELMNPTYDESTHTATYSVNILQEDEAVDMQFQQEPADKPALDAYKDAHLFIDDCPDTTYCCRTSNGGNAGYLVVGTCWSWKHLTCDECRNYDQDCNDTYPDACQGSCTLGQC